MAAIQSFVLTVLSFALLISVLVFFHELGHFLVARLCGVKATRFSIGFGSRLFGFQWGETEFRVSMLPFGGYVKFAGDVPGEELPPEDRGRGFLEAAPLKRAAIALAGPMANFLLALVLYFAISLAPMKDNAPFVGYVKPGWPAAAAGVEAGDTILEVDGHDVPGFSAFQELIHERAGKAVALKVKRGGQVRDLRLTPATHEETNPLETVKRGRIGVMNRPLLPEVAVLGPQTPAARAGLRDFDLVYKLDGQKIDTYEQLSRQLGERARANAPVALDVLRKRAVAAPGGTLWVQEPEHIVIPSPQAAADAPVAGAPPAGPAAAYGLEAADMTLFTVQPGSAAEKAGLRRGDRIVSVQGAPAILWIDEVESARKRAGAAPLQLLVRREGNLLAVSVSQTMRAARDEAGVRTQAPELGAAPDFSIFEGPVEQVSFRYSLGEAAARAAGRFREDTRQSVLSLVKLVTGSISSEAVGGPLMIADVARSAADAGWRVFLLAMAVVSISLGLMNLIPIPVLDGFHVLSALLEGIFRRPLPLRFREIANMVGVALVLSLMLFALKNDVVRKFMD